MQKTVENDDGYGHNIDRLKDEHQEEYAPVSMLSLPIDRIPNDI